MTPENKTNIMLLGFTIKDGTSPGSFLIERGKLSINYLFKENIWMLFGLAHYTCVDTYEELIAYMLKESLL